MTKMKNECREQYLASAHVNGAVAVIYLTQCCDTSAAPCVFYGVLADLFVFHHFIGCIHSLR